MNILICNVGSSDLGVGSLAGLSDGGRLSERERAQQVLADYMRYREQITLPLIGKALGYVQQQPDELGLVVLVASNQADVEPAAGTQAHRHWSSDTCYTAQVVQQRLTEQVAGQTWQPVPLERVVIWEIRDADGGGRNPTDYDGVRRFFERELAAVRAAYPAATAFLEVTGGTPAMTTGLLVAGTEVFRERAEVLYIHPTDALPHRLNTGKRLLAGPLREGLRSMIRTYAYDVAGRSLEQQAAVIGDRLEPGAVAVLRAVLGYAHCRASFDFPGAVAALRGADQAGDGRWREAVMQLANAVHQPGRVTLLEEVYFGAVARFEIGAYADFLTQLVRFDENVLRHVCLAQGAVFLNWQEQPDPAGALLSRAWLRSLPTPPPSIRDDGRNAMVGRGLLQQLAKHLDQERNWQAVLAMSEQLTPLVRLRNDLTHSLAGVRQADLAVRFNGDADAILAHLARLFAAVAGRAAGPFPYGQINALIEDLLHERQG